MKFKKNQKLSKIVFKIISFFACVIVIYNIIFLIQKMIYKKDYFTFFDFIVVSQNDKSMTGSISKNSLVVMRKSNFDTLTNDMIIGYDVSDKMKISKVVQIDTSNGNKSVITKQENSYYPNIENVSNSEVIWKLVFSLKFCGILIKVFQSKIFTLLIFIFMVVAFIFNIDKYSNQRLRQTKLYYVKNNNKKPR